MNEVKIFNNPEFGDIRTLTIDGEPWFVGKDVAMALGYSNTKDALITHIEKDDKRILQRSEITTIENNIPKSVFPANFVSTDIPNRGLTIINESGLYSLILSSKLPNAKKFKHWVTSEVLPALRKTGTYSIVQAPAAIEQRVLTSDDYIKAAQIVAGCRNERLPYVVHLLKKGGFDLPNWTDGLSEEDFVGRTTNDAYREYGGDMSLYDFENEVACAFGLTVIVQAGTGRHRHKIFMKSEGE